MTEFRNRVFGCAIVKAINSNYNADFSGQPRTLPSGIVYATDKAFKYMIKRYLKDVYPNEPILNFKRFKSEFTPLDLSETYEYLFKAKVSEDTLDAIAKNLLSCIDVRFFGATFAPKGQNIKNKNLSIHGPVQINHGVNIWKENNIFTEQILSPFRNPDKNPEDTDKKNDQENQEKQATTIGRQSKLEEGHYLHHFSINPKNLKDVTAIAAEGKQILTSKDIDKLKEAMRRSVTWYDSASKAGCENEMLVWIQLSDDSKIVLPNFLSLIDLLPNKKDNKYVFDFSKFNEKLQELPDEIETIEIYYNKQTVILENKPENAIQMDI
ncbi:MAG: CRISPR-associated protein Csh2 [Clostridium butyricum]|jgi:CRISPR-associated protein Csh2|nr:CRISPR-associated protein Csh2 [Clostridium butyricum]